MLMRRQLARCLALLACGAGLAGAGAAGPGLAAQESRPAQGEDVRYANGALMLAGELLLPPSPRGRVPAAVVIQGSGASDRRNPWARAVADQLVRRGVAVLLTDKRGSGASAGDWRTAGFDDLAGDALAGVAFLRGRSDIDSTRIGLIGLSQGAWVAPLAAARSPSVAFVIDVAGATVSYAEQSFVEMRNTARQAGLPADQVAEVLELNQAAGQYLASGVWEPYQRLRERALGRPWAKIAAGFPAAREAPIWTFLGSVFAFDPMPYWMLLSAPVLVAFGEKDEDDNVPVQESVRRLVFAFSSTGKRNYRVVVVPGVGHSLMSPRTHEFAPAFVDALDEWTRTYVIRDRAGAARPR